ncbi:hypothetical protein ACXYL9_12565 [Qipengyuania sp. CAU 1752]
MKSALRDWRTIEDIDLSQFDFVWAQHHSILTLLDRHCDSKRPFIVWASLSPYEEMEQLPVSLIKAFFDRAVGNSIETVEARGMERSFDNAAPAAFHFDRDQREAQNILFVSNNQPPEMVKAAALLKQRGLSIRFIGRGHEYKRIEPSDIGWADRVVTIGKTARYALASKTPVYIYDRFGGDGYLTSENYLRNEQHNFSGRPNERRVGAVELAEEIAGPVPPLDLPPQSVFEKFIDQLVAEASPQPFARTPDLAGAAAMALIIGRFLRLQRGERERFFGRYGLLRYARARLQYAGILP